ncbi:M4 family metallopeptidase [Clostridium psychrophilum]|uniref:M4 family metallopeptidase n=1 Tax=Clostridium psychrophilum TaxID=132926 RepID=UPI001C0C7E95|nr:M4 family metallopeptidase [Clostridium psychrophilum]MBU3180998.1 M4 family metallopeptidase [Clostridium psychrophilum]
MRKNKFIKKIIAVTISTLMVLLNTSTLGFAATTSSATNISVTSNSIHNNFLNNLKKYNKSNVQVDENNESNGELFISGILSDPKTPSVKEALTFLDQNKTIIGLNNIFSDFKDAKIIVDNAGFTHIKLYQYISGLPVEDKQITVHFNKGGIITSVTGNVVLKTAIPVRSLAKSFINKITSSEAISIAKGECTKMDSLTSKNSQGLLKGQAAKLSSEPTANKTFLVIGKKVYEVYLVNVKYTTPIIGNWDVYVDTSSGKVISKQSNIRYGDVPAIGTGTGVNGKTKSLNLELENNKTYLMTDLTKPMLNSNNITTFSANNGDGTKVYEGTSSNGKFTSEKDKALVDAHYNAGAVYDFYKTLFNRNSIDGKGMEIRSVAHLGSKYNNAFWDGYSTMWYGDGDGSMFTYLSGDLGIVGHEMTHGVTQANGDLSYNNQSGALDESISDVFGVLIKTYNKYNVKNHGTWTFNPSDWVIGQDVYTPKTSGDALRSLANPTLYGQPDNINSYENLPDDYDDDYGGVHTNSGIPNKAAYLIAKSIGMKKTAEIYYDAYNYFNYNIDFKGAANAIIRAATDLYGASSSEVKAVKTSFITVNALPIPTSLKVASSSYNSINVSFNKVQGASKYEIWRTSKGIYTLIGTTTSTKYNNTGLIPNSKYYYKVRAYKMVGALKEYSGFTTGLGSKPIPSVPTSLKVASSSYNGINVSFKAVQGANRYEVWRTSKGKYTLIGTTSSTNYNNTGLTTNNTYYYKVRAYRMVGTLKVYSGFTTGLGARPVPGAPTTVKATRVSSRSIKLTWRTVSGTSGYEVYRASSSNGKYGILSRTSHAYYTNSSLAKGRTYYYKVRSYRNVGKTRVYGNLSSIVHAKP